MLHRIDAKGWNGKAWCGPSAVSTLTGAPLIHTHSRAAFYQNQAMKKVKGMYNEEVILLLREQGYGVRQIDLTERFETQPTINMFMKSRTPYEFAMPILLGITNHFISVHMNWACDNWTLNPVPFNEFPKPKRRVEFAFVVIREKNPC
tara:strand:+ start:190 stop:633 length:444 start_codon:yes stop_codon:yes gene_type:complete